MKVEILGTQYECRPLSAADRRRWNLYLHYENQRTFYSDLYSQVEHLPEPLQVAVFAKHSPPERLDPSMPAYYKVASTPAAVRYLLEMMIEEDTLKVTEDNAAEVLLAVRDAIFPVTETLDTEKKQEAARDTFSKLEGEDNAG